MRVSLILHTFSRGGSDRVAAHLARGFTDRGLLVRMIVFSRGGEVEQPLTDLVGDDIPIVYLGRRHRSRPLDLLIGLRELVRELRKRPPDAVISTANNTALVTALALRIARLRQTRLILKTTNPIAQSRHGGLAKRIRDASYRLIFGWTTAVWTLSAEETEELRVAFPKFASIFNAVQNPYVTEPMFAERQHSRQTTDAKTIICVARLTAQKRLDRLIAAFALIRHPDTKLVILGEGEDRASLVAQVQQLGLTGRVELRGYDPDVAGALQDADLFVLTSAYEGLPAVILEAMAANCPVLSTPCFPAARSLLGNSEGCAIIEDPRPAPLAALIDQALSRPRPTHLRETAARYSIANGVESHARALQAAVSADTPVPPEPTFR